MSAIALAEAVDFYRIDASLKLDPGRRAALGQYMTPVPISRFMASLFSEIHGDLRVLDPGAGVGSLTTALAELEHGVSRQPELFGDGVSDDVGFTHAILNPPYRKIKADSAHREALRRNIESLHRVHVRGGEPLTRRR